MIAMDGDQVKVEDSILLSIKKLLGMDPIEFTQYDTDLIIHINSVFMILTQMGVGPADGFSIKDKTAKWADFISEDEKLEGVKSYVALKVKILFDPPSGASVLDCTNKMIQELEWRLYSESDIVRGGETNE